MVGWDPDRQVVELAFDQNDFRTWNFVIAVLKMATSVAEARHRAAMAQQMQAAMAEQRLAEGLRKNLGV